MNLGSKKAKDVAAVRWTTWEMDCGFVGASRCTHLSHKVHICAKDGLEPLSLFEELSHGPVVLPHVFLALLLLIEEFGQMVPETQVHLEAAQSTVKPTDRTSTGTGLRIKVEEKKNTIWGF